MRIMYTNTAIIRKLWQKLQSLLKGYEKAGSQEA